jgi:ATPase subunit of ABC transporter with duplicated ATPase domains
MELQHGKLTSYGGGYEFYLEERERRLQRQIQEFEREQEELTHLKEKIRSLTFSSRPHRGPTDSNKLGYNHRGSGQQKSIQRTLENYKTKLARFEENPCQHPRPKTISGLAFARSPLQSEVVIELDHVSKCYGSKVVLKEFTAQLLRGQRIAICGPNGCGKSTLLACASGQLAVDGGQLRLCSSARVGYLDQDMALLPMQQSPAGYFADRFRLSHSDICSELFKSGLEGHELIQRPFNTLSTGQRKRMMLLSLLLSQPNVLLLDEPTNHLDFHTLEALEMALLNFDGAIIAVSHDRTFIEKIATDVWRMPTNDTAEVF